jgi:hypothetical protein
VVDSYDPQGISFDLACFFSGDAAVVAAAEDGAESPPPNDYYVRNQNETLRQLDIAATVPVTWYPTGDPQDIAAGEFSEWIGHLSQEEFWLAIWVTITDGEVSEIVEQWVP